MQSNGCDYQAAPDRSISPLAESGHYQRAPFTAAYLHALPALPAYLPSYLPNDWRQPSARCVWAAVWRPLSFQLAQPDAPLRLPHLRGRALHRLRQ